MEFKQVQPPEGINTSSEHPLREFSWLLATVIVLVVLLVGALSFAAHWLAPLVPFSTEQKITRYLEPAIAAQDSGQAPARNDIETYLQTLADRLVASMDLPEGMDITVHYLDEESVNAFATLGGHVYFFRGLLQSVPDENALAMVVAHEIAHVLHRHPIRSLGRGVIVGTAMSVISTAAGGEIVNRVLGQGGMMTALKFSRDQEEQADEVALSALAALYGHVDGAEDLFVILQQRQGEFAQPPEFFSTHPLSDSRIASMRAHAVANGWALQGPRTPLPAAISTWLDQSAQ